MTTLQSLGFIDKKPIFPLTVGMTGHREFQEVARSQIREKTTLFFRNLCQLWKELHEGKNVPILVFDGMAQGADQLVAEVVGELREKPETDCLKLVAVTPLPMEYYRKDFKTAESLHVFEIAMMKAEARIELPLTEENQKCEKLGQKIHRTEQYASLGKFLAMNSLVLLALWDGKDLETAHPGGTGNVVRLKLDGGGFLQENLLKDLHFHKIAREFGPSLGGVFQIETPRGNLLEPFPGIKTCYWGLSDSIYQGEACSSEDFFRLQSILSPMKAMAKANLDAIR